MPHSHCSKTYSGTLARRPIKYLKRWTTVLPKAITLYSDGRLVHKLFGDHFESRREEIRLALASFLEFEEAAEFLSPDGFASLLTLIGN